MAREHSAPCSSTVPLADSLPQQRARWERRGVRLREECWQATHRAAQQTTNQSYPSGQPSRPPRIWGGVKAPNQQCGCFSFIFRPAGFLSLFLWPGCGCSRELRTWGMASPPRVFPKSITDKQLINERRQILPIHVCPSGKRSAPGWAPPLSGRHLVWTPENTLTANSHAGRHGSFCRLLPVHSRTALSC